MANAEAETQPGSRVLLDALSSAGSHLSDADPSTHDRLVQALVALGDPETLGAITRMAQVAPQLEYAVHAVAAGPELLGELTETIQQWSEQGGKDLGPARITAAQDAIALLSDPSTLRSLERLALITPALTPALEGIAQGMHELEHYQGAQALRQRLADTVTQVGDPEVLDSLARVLSLAPKLEYAAHAVAAGPELLDEALDVVREHAGETHTLQSRLSGAAQILADLSTPQTLRSLQSLVQALPTVGPLLHGVSESLGEVQKVRGEDLHAELQSLLLRLADRETLASIQSMLDILPKLEYLLHAGAAGPELLQELMELVQARTSHVSSTALKEDGAELLTALLQPQLLRGLTGVAQGLSEQKLREVAKLVEATDLEALADLAEQSKALTSMASKIPWAQLEQCIEPLTKPAVIEALGEILDKVPTVLLPLVRTLPTQKRTLDLLVAANDAVDGASSVPTQRGAMGLWRALGDPDVQTAMGVAVEVARQTGAYLRQNARPLPKKR